MTRTLFIGLDGATFTVLDRLTAPDPSTGAVVMPCLARLMRTGTRAILRSTRNPLTPPAWVSLMTGRTPGHHGVYDFLRAEERADDVYFTLYDARDIRTETIWSIATRQQRKVVALNFPITAPPRGGWGTVVPGFVPWKHLRRNVVPEGLFDRLRALDGFDPKALAWDFELESKAMDALDDADLEQWVAYHLPREEQWFRIAEKLLREERPDLMAVMFDGTDKIQHQAWAYLEGAADLGDGQALRIRELCNRYFRNLDGYIDRLVELAGPQAQVFFASDHGFTGSTEVVRINAFLASRGYLAFRAGNGSEPSQRRGRSWFADLDWTRTTAYCRTPSSNGITIRVARDDAAAGVPPEQYEAFRRRLVADLEDLRDEAGERVIAAVTPREEAFPGAAVTDAPDLILTLRDFGFVSIANIRPIVEKRTRVAGTHHPDGILIGCGPGIAPGHVAARRNIPDVAAILLHSVGLAVPEDFEGEVPAEMFTTAQLREQPIHRGRATLPVEPSGAGPHAGAADAEKEKIVRQLQMLGYME